MAGVRAYYWRWLKTSFTHSLGPIDLWTGLISAAVTIIDHFFGLRLMETLGWQIFLWALAGVMAVRLILAPYWMAREDAGRIAELEAGKLSEERRREIAGVLATFLEEGERLRLDCRNVQMPPPTRQSDDWFQRLHDYLSKTPELGAPYLAMLNTSTGMPLTVNDIPSDQHRILSSALRVRVFRLTEFVTQWTQGNVTRQAPKP